MSHLENTPPLVGDPERQAPDLHKGLVYQIWQTVEAWIRLKEDELLFIEGAEDYDVVSKGNATTVQVKATTAKLSLRSGAIIDALNSYWLIKNKNKDKTIWLRFITSSPITSERGDPFGVGQSGLSLWQSCVATGDLAFVHQLKKFLTTDNVFAPKIDQQINTAEFGSTASLLDFLKTAPAQRVFDELISHISWETQSGDSAVVKEAVAIYLTAHGEKMRLRPNECEPAIDKLFRIVAEFGAKKNDRTLSLHDFRIAFDDATSKKYSRSEFAVLKANAMFSQQAFASPLIPAGELLVSVATMVQTGIPDLPPNCIKRTQLIDRVFSLIGKHGGIIIKGSSGMGKSTLAKLLAQKAGGDWIWADFQGLDAKQVPQIVRLFANYSVQAHKSYNLALDNLDFDLSRVAQIDNSLAAVIRRTKIGGGTFIITTQQNLTASLKQKCSLESDAVFDIPYFSDTEICDFCNALGCPDSERSALLAKIIRLQTSGHPQLVHARLIGLSLKAWPCLSADDLFAETREVSELLDVSRQLLADTPSDDKELLYRLSLYTGPFRRDHAIATANIEPALKFAGDSFARLVGPWIEIVSDEYYRLSPLLSKAAKQNWTPDVVLSLRGHLAHAILKCEKRSLLEASEILLQGLLAQDEFAVSSVAIGLGGLPLEAGRQIADHLFWLIAFGRAEHQMIFPKNLFINLLVRLIQFRVIVERCPSDIEWICDLIDGEMAGLQSGDRSPRIIWVTQAQMFYRAKIAPKRLVSYWSELVDLLSEESEFREMAVKAAGEIAESCESTGLDFAGNLFLMILAREGDVDYFIEFVKAVDDLTSTKRELAIGYIHACPCLARLAIDRCWLKESEKAEPNWVQMISSLKTILPLATKLGVGDLVVFIWRAIAVIEDEYLHNAVSALEAVQCGAKANSSLLHLLDDERAMIYFRQEKFNGALEIWRRILPIWGVKGEFDDLQPLFSCQRAGNAAGNVCDWVLAAHFFVIGQRVAKQLGSELHVLTFLADEAYVRWKLGERASALRKLIDVVMGLEGLKSDSDDDFEFHRAWKSIEQVIKWCRKDSGFGDTLDAFEPPTGFCSKREAHEKLKEIPRSPVEFLWFFLADIEFRLNCGRSALAIAMSRIPQSNSAPFKGSLARLHLSVMFRDLDFDSLIESTVILSSAYSEVHSEIPDSMSKPALDVGLDLLAEVMFCALTTLAASSTDIDTFLPRWSKAIDKWTNDCEVKGLVGRISRVIRSDSRIVHLIYRDTTEIGLTRLVAALRMATDPEEQLSAMFHGQSFVLGTLSKSGFKHEVSEAFGKIVRRTWLERLRFGIEFSAPRLTIPAIKAACDDSGRGLGFAARVLLQARFAVPSVKVPVATLAEWQSLATGN